MALVLALSGGVAAHAEVTEPAGELLGGVAVDVDREGVGEVASVHATTADPTAREYTSEVVVRRGVDGAPLWSVVVPTGAITLTTAAVGPDGTPGVLLLVRRFNYFVNISTTEDGVSVETPVPLLYAQPNSGFDLYALTAGGESVWEHHLTAGQSGDDPLRSKDQPLALVVLQATASPADDVLMILGDAPLVTTQQNNDDFDIRATVIDGTDGSTSSSVLAAQGVAYQAPPVTVGDFDGDTLDDYVLQLPDASIVAHRGSDGQRLWQGDGEFFGLRTIPDLTGDGISDVFATATGLGNRTTGDASILDGSTGASRLEVIAEHAWPTPSGIAAATPAESEDAMGWELEEIDLKGIVRRTRSLTVPRAETTNAGLQVNVGDLNGNGTDDVIYTFTPRDAMATSDRGVFDGASLATLWTGAPGVPLHASVEGADGGDDLLLWEPWGRYAVDLTAQRGASGAALWTRRIVPAWDDTTMVQVSAADVNGDGRADVLTELHGERRTSVGEVPEDLGRRTDRATQLHVLDGRGGSLLWQR